MILYDKEIKYFNRDIKNHDNNKIIGRLTFKLYSGQRHGLFMTFARKMFDTDKGRESVLKRLNYSLNIYLKRKVYSKQFNMIRRLKYKK